MIMRKRVFNFAADEDRQVSADTGVSDHRFKVGEVVFSNLILLVRKLLAQQVDRILVLILFNIVLKINMSHDRPTFHLDCKQSVSKLLGKC